MTNVERVIRILEAEQIKYASVADDPDGVRVTWINKWSSTYALGEIDNDSIRTGHRLAMRAAKAGCPCCDNGTGPS